MAVEDFTTYTLVNGNGKLSVTSTRATAATWDTRQDLGYAQFDKTTSHFSGDFSHLVTIDATSIDATNGIVCAWILSNATGDLHTQQAGSLSFLAVFFQGTTLILRDGNVGTLTSDTWGAATNTIYYLTIARVGTTTTCKVYSDSGRTTLTHTLSITPSAATAFQYVAVAAGYNDSNNGLFSGYVENLDLQEGPPPSDTEEWLGSSVHPKVHNFVHVSY
jgi:hypothetical protein